MKKALAKVFRSPGAIRVEGGLGFCCGTHGDKLECTGSTGSLLACLPACPTPAPRLPLPLPTVDTYLPLPTDLPACLLPAPMHASIHARIHAGNMNKQKQENRHNYAHQFEEITGFEVRLLPR